VLHADKLSRKALCGGCLRIAPIRFSPASPMVPGRCDGLNKGPSAELHQLVLHEKAREGPPLVAMTTYGVPFSPVWPKPKAADPVEANATPYTTAEAAKALGVGKTTVKALIASGDLKSYKTRSLRFVTREASPSTSLAANAAGDGGRSERQEENPGWRKLP